MTTTPASEQAEQAELAELAEAREELRAVARDLLSKGRPPAVPDWSVLAASGWLGLEVPAALDGAGATFAETAVIAEELGRAAARAPYLGATVLGAGALLAAAPGAERDALLAKAAAGEEIAVAVLASDSGPLPANAAFRLTPHGTGQDQRYQLSGQAAFQPDAAQATLLLIVAYRDAPGDEGPATTGTAREPVLVTLRPGTPGLRITQQPVLDETRSLAEVTAEAVEVPPAALWHFAGDPHGSLRRLAGRAAVAVACDSLGVAAAMLDATVAYAKVREQFGRPIGSFQAVKHACADMLVKVTVARQLITAAVTAVSGTAGTDPAGASTAAAMAKSYAGDAAVEVAGTAMQLHGGIGYTWESGIHYFLKRAALNRELFGSPEAHRRRLAARYR